MTQKNDGGPNQPINPVTPPVNPPPFINGGDPNEAVSADPPAGEPTEPDPVPAKGPPKPGPLPVEAPTPVEEEAKAAATPKDARDIEALWDDPGLGDGLTVTSMHLIPIDKPKNFFRVCDLPAYRRRTEMYIHKVEGEMDKSYYILGKKMKGKLLEARNCTLVTCIYRDGSVRLWPIPLPRDGEHDNKAWVSARAAARTAMTKWVKLVWVGGAYKTRDANSGYAPDPDWTKLSPFNELVDIAFGANQGFMDDENHPIYREHLSGDGLSDNDDDDGI